MRTPEVGRVMVGVLIGTVLACAVAVAGCDRLGWNADARKAAQAREAAADMKAVAGRAGDQLADTWLTTKIQAQYFADEDIKARYINVKARDGQVTLTGRVDTAAAREQAVQIARNTDGVRQVDDQLHVGPKASNAGVLPEQMDSAWVTTTIQAKFFAEPDVNGQDIAVSTTNGVVTLSGRVATEQQKALAMSIAQKTDGVSHVEDRLAVQPAGAVATGGALPVPTAAAVDDAQIVSRIQSKFFLDEAVKGRRIEVSSQQGVVSLRGDVGSESERGQALLLARTTEGVQRVEDHLSVRLAAAPLTQAHTGTAPAAPAASSPTTSSAIPPAATQAEDSTVATKIQSKFFLDPKVRASAIEVSSKDGIVLLQGTVPSEVVRKQALTIARSTDGVLQVVDRLKVGTKR